MPGHATPLVSSSSRSPAAAVGGLRDGPHARPSRHLIGRSVVQLRRATFRTRCVAVLVALVAARIAVVTRTAVTAVRPARRRSWSRLAFDTNLWRRQRSSSGRHADPGRGRHRASRRTRRRRALRRLIRPRDSGATAREHYRAIRRDDRASSDRKASCWPPPSGSTSRCSRPTPSRARAVGPKEGWPPACRY